MAEEAARLVELLSGTAAAAAAAGARWQSAGGHTGREDSADSGTGPADDPAGSADPSAGTGCTCGGPAACRLCPLCQLIAFIQRVDPEAIDRLAEVVELAATGLRDLATAQRGRQGPDRPEGPGPQ